MKYVLTLQATFDDVDVAPTQLVTDLGDEFKAVYPDVTITTLSATPAQ